MSSDVRLDMPTRGDPDHLKEILERVAGSILGYQHHAVPMKFTQRNSPGEAAVQVQNKAASSPAMELLDKNGNVMFSASSEGGTTGLLGADGKPIVTQESTDTFKNKTITDSSNHISAGILDSGVIPAARGVGIRQVKYAYGNGGSGDSTTTSASYVDVPTMSVTLTPIVASCVLICIFFASVFITGGASQPAARMDFAIAIDAGTDNRIMRISPWDTSSGVGQDDRGIVGAYPLTGVSLASHTVKARWRVDADTANMREDGRMLIVMEIA